MGIFFPDDPDYFPEIRPSGFKRYKQVLERNWKQFFLADLLTLAGLLPFGFGLGYAIYATSVLVLIPVCVIGGLIAGPFTAAMYDLILARLRDNLDDWWYRWKKSMRQNLRASLLPGVVMCLFIGFLAFSIALIWWATVPPTPGTVAVLAASAMLCLMVFSVWWPQVVLFDQKPGIQLKNCILFCIRYFWKVVGVAAQQLVWWAFLVVILPWSAFVIPFLGVWYIWFVSCFFLYDPLDEAFCIEEQIAQAFPEQTAGAGK